MEMKMGTEQKKMVLPAEIVQAAMGRAQRLLPPNEPELANAISVLLAEGVASGEVERWAQVITGRRDTGRLAFWFAESLARDETQEGGG